MVSRETPPAPDEARGVFSSERWSLAERYVAILADQGVVRGLIGPREAPRLWERHVISCARVGELVPRRASVCDVGSGAGLPGVVLAIVRPDLTVTLVEPLLRRATFLDEVVSELDLEQVEVVRARAEDLGRQPAPRAFDVVTSRAVAPLDRLLGWSWPLVAPGGDLVAMKGRTAAEEVHSASGVLRRLDAAPPEILILGSGESTATVVRVTRRGSAPVSSRDARRRGRGRAEGQHG